MFCIRLISVLMLSALLTACGGGGAVPDAGATPVKGKITKGGQPLKISDKLPPGDVGIHVQFVAVDGSGGFDADVNPATGEFTIPGATGKGIKPGSYRVEVVLGPFGLDSFKGKYSGPKTPITRTIEPGKDVLIDLDKP